MRPSTFVALAAVLALMAGAMAVAATSSLLSGTHPDPYEHNSVYGVSGVVDDEAVSCTASCITVHENGAFHNYLLRTELPSGTEEFLITFEPDGKPSLLEYAGTKTLGDSGAEVYSGIIGGTEYTVTVSEFCTIVDYSVSHGGTHYTGILQN